MSREAEPTLRPLVRRALFAYWQLARGMTLGVRGIALTGAGEVFLIRHTYVEGWHLPGGGVERGETALDALKREFDEEARIALDAEPRLHGIFLNEALARRDHVLVYVTREFRILAPKQPDREIAEVGLFPLTALPPGTTPATRRRLDEVVSGRAADATW